MAAVEVTISGVLYDKLNRTQQSVVLIGEGSLTGLGVGGGPIYPPPGSGGGGGGGRPPGPVDPGYGYPEKPVDPEYGVPGPPYPGVPPVQEPPQPGDPTTVIPGNWPVQPVTPPPYLIVNYPGIGPVKVAPPASGESPKT